MSMGRRGFLRGLTLGTVALGSTSREVHAGGGAHRFVGHPGRTGLLHDVTLCVGCRSCEAACNRVNSLPDPDPPLGDQRAFRGHRLLSDELYTVVNRYRPAQGRQPAVYRKHQCMHCNEPCCASVCFVKAFTKTPEGPVLYHPDLCVGCRYCVFACPYYALSYEYSDPLTPRVVRCTMCYSRIVQGMLPGCAEACPSGAIRFGERADLLHLARERIRKYPGRYVDHVFGEHEFAGTSWLTIGGMPFAELGLHEEVTHTPLPDFTTSFLSLAPLVAAIFPGMLGGFYAFTKRRERLARESNHRVAQEMREELQGAMEHQLRELAERAALEKEQAVERAIRATLRQVEPPPGSPGSPLAPAGGPPSSLGGGPASPLAGPRSPLAGPGSSPAGPSSPLAGPPSSPAGPSSPLAAPPSSPAGPSSPLAGPPSSLGEPPAANKQKKEGDQ